VTSPRGRRNPDEKAASAAPSRAKLDRRLVRHGAKIRDLETRLEATTEAEHARMLAFEEKVAERFAVLDGLLDHVRTVPGGGALRVSDPAGRTVMGYVDAEPLAPDSAYVEFEGHFRGSRAEIQERQRPYLDLLSGHEPVLDLGCGRGELLELLRDAGIAARGVDLDVGMVRAATDLGLDASVGDLFDALADAPDGSLGAVVSFQVAEHLPPEDLRRLLGEVHRALADDGVVVLETVNPHSLRAFRFFWLDITHRIPLFPESLLSLARGCGFPAAVAWFPASLGLLEDDLRECGDYAIVCAKSAAPLVRAGLLSG
jgi:SAM-dependent methyltransferase